MELLNLDHIKQALSGSAAAFRCVTAYQPAGGEGDKIFPATYEGGNYATELRRIDGLDVPCVLIDSVQSQANRMETALLEEWEGGGVSLPVIVVDFTGCDLPKPFRVTSLEAPHRVADALLRDSELDGTPFRRSDVGKRIDLVDVRNATALFELCPTALVFGMWDSTGPRGGAGSKFQRAIVSEIIGLHAVPGKKTSSRIDPAQVLRSAGPVYRTTDGGWTPDHSQAAAGQRTGLRPSEVNHGNIAPSIDDGGFTISEARQTTVLSLAALRRLRFPINGSAPNPATDRAARVALVALALLGAALVREAGADLRSRCLLFPTETFVWELLNRPGSDATRFELPAGQAREIYAAALAEAKSAGLPWMEEALTLTPSPQLTQLVRHSQELAASVTGGDSDGV